jgi:serine/threonine protein phosphatase PrpC
MGFFRRIFGAGDGDSQEQSVQVPHTGETAPEDEPELDAIDAETRPIPATPVAPPIADGVTRPLSPDKMPTIHDDFFATAGEHLRFGHASHVGKVRTNNQDAVLTFYVSSESVEAKPSFGLFVVADGMGGHHDGEKASAITTRVVASEVLRNLYLPTLADDPDDRVPTTEVMIEAVHRANAEVIKHVPDGGTTVTAALVIGDLAHIVHVGDSRAYLISKEGVEQITRDHSLVQRLIELDQLTREEAAEHSQRNVLYRALGQNESLEVDTLTRRLPNNSRLLICSDGLWGLVEERELFEVAMNTADPQQACDKLIALANAQGGTDNITAIMLAIAD